MSAARSSQIGRDSSLGSTEFTELIRIVWLPAVMVAVFAGAVTFGISFVVDPQYQIKVVLEYVGDPTKQTSPQRSSGAGLGSLAAIAGINLSSDGNSKEAALATLKSHDFVRAFITRHGLMRELNADKWDSTVEAWKDEPNVWQTVERFREKVMRVSEDPKTGLITVWIEWRDPTVASRWATDIVAMINQRLKDVAVKETNRSLAHLREELANTQNVELQRVIARLTESQIEALMFADIREEFAFRTIDSAAVPPEDEYDAPNHLLFLIFGAIFGGVLGVFLALWIALRRTHRSGP